jgi:predicted nucleic acid-binding protein
VLDASVTAAWCFEDQSTPYTDAVLQAVINGAEVLVPAIWRFEVANILVVAERRKKISPEKTARFIQALKSFAIAVDLDGVDTAFGTVLEHARQYQRSAYDAAYLELAHRRRLPFATKDGPLQAAADALRIPAFQPVEYPG